MDTRNNPFSQFDWNEFEKYFQGIIPQKPGDSNSSSWIADYVQQIIKDNVPGVQSGSNTKHYDTEIIETAENLLLKIKVPDKAEAQNLNVFTTGHQIKIESKDSREIQWFRLPHPVDPASCKAVYKDGALQLLLRKLGKKEPFVQTDIEFP